MELTRKQLKDKITELTAEYYKIGCDEFLKRPTEPLSVSFKLESIHVAGRANFVTNTVTYNLEMAYCNQEEFLKRTVGHEVAHIIADSLWYNNSGHHGKVWKSVMLFFKIPPTRCHSYDLTNMKTNRKLFFYTCDCSSQYAVGQRQHTNIQVADTYRCTKCKSKVRLIK